MKIKTDEIVSVLKKEIQSFESQLDLSEVGEVISIGDGIARVYGLENVMFNEMVEFEDGTLGLAFNLEENNVGIVVLGPSTQLREGYQVKRTGRVLEVPVGDALLGRIVDPMGRPLDGKGPIDTDKMYPVERLAPGIAKREPVKIPMQTGIKAIDSMIPVGRGQRELIIGDRGTGKTAIAIDTIINQKGGDVICVYVAIGQKASKVAALYEKLKELGCMDYSIIVSASASDPAPLQYLAPYAGCSMAEYFMYEKGRHTLAVYDDLTKQANAYRQMSLLLRRPPGREAYPGDVFYLHSRLLERAAKMSEKYGGGSLTALPIIETQEGEVSAFIPTNVISITDGQIYLQPGLFASGQRPAVDVGISVSRVGGSAQIKAMKSVAGKLRLDQAAFKALEAFAQLGTDMDAATQAQLDRGYRVMEVLKQGESAPWAVEDQVLAIFAVTRGLMDKIPLSRAKEFESALISYLHDAHSELVKGIREKKVIEDDKALEATIKDFAESFLAGKAADIRHQSGE
ncbi:MAG: F0F1 ATP synthase subunit alpha [Spirochaetaceae bacterium]|nr:F0F1 ATP synthase subunit alpha [Spirochaetaceae bacterium]|tara:strand:- start:73903 stop:75444 length:1542 start_codon:yes stop_codon:yes gene_type:complete